MTKTIISTQDLQKSIDNNELLCFETPAIKTFLKNLELMKANHPEKVEDIQKAETDLQKLTPLLVENVMNSKSVYKTVYVKYNNVMIEEELQKGIEDGKILAVYPEDIVKGYKNELLKLIANDGVDVEGVEYDEYEIQKAKKDLSRLTMRRIVDKNGHQKIVYVRTSKDEKGNDQEHHFEQGHDVEFEHNGEKMKGKIHSLKYHHKDDKAGTAIIHTADGKKVSKSLERIEYADKNDGLSKTALRHKEAMDAGATEVEADRIANFKLGKDDHSGNDKNKDIKDSKHLTDGGKTDAQPEKYLDGKLKYPEAKEGIDPNTGKAASSKKPEKVEQKKLDVVDDNSHVLKQDLYHDEYSGNHTADKRNENGDKNMLLAKKGDKLWKDAVEEGLYSLHEKDGMVVDLTDDMVTGSSTATISTGTKTPIKKGLGLVKTIPANIKTFLKEDGSESLSVGALNVNKWILDKTGNPLRGGIVVGKSGSRSLVLDVFSRDDSLISVSEKTGEIQFRDKPVANKKEFNKVFDKYYEITKSDRELDIEKAFNSIGIDISK